MFNKQEMIREVREVILPFWQELIDEENGGFFGETDFIGVPNKTADKGCILNSRILWTFSAAFRIFEDDAYKKCALQARDFLRDAYLDKEHGGLYWLVDHKGKTLNDRKQFYNIAFGIYALSEHYLATGDITSLEIARQLFDVIEKYGFDANNGGYIEARQRDWSDIDDFRLSDKEINCPKSMNTNLHVLEAYTTYVLAENHAAMYDGANKSLVLLTQATMDHIINDEWRFDLFFDMDWNVLTKDISYGHDIEGSWLLYDAALTTGDQKIIEKAGKVAVNVAEAVYRHGIDLKNGGLFVERGDDGVLSSNKDWWSQAEAVVGFYNAYKLSGDAKYLKAAEDIWEFAMKYFSDRKNGEWHNEIDENHIPIKSFPKASFWKCPYHNSRACFEMINRF
ncbi:MAG: AGE family epimerase/isomerase [Oscillospiraceae bacterium]|jgi:mannobiose 2-epimerase|nr:AGE family epimerase/isomerase [Oscillospiraceae bacterium]